MTATFLLLFAGAIAVLGRLLTQALFFLGRRRDQLQQRLSTGAHSSGGGGSGVGLSTHHAAQGRRQPATLLAQRRILGEFSRRLGLAYPGVTIARFVLIEMIVVLAMLRCRRAADAIVCAGPAGGGVCGVAAGGFGQHAPRQAAAAVR